MRLNIPAVNIRKYGLGRIIMDSRQKAVNQVFGSLKANIYFNSPPLVTESAFEFIPRKGKKATEVAAQAFQSFSKPDAELDSHYIYQRLNGPNDTVLAMTLGGTLSILSDREIKALVLNTGMSAFTTVFDLLRPGDALFYHPVLYGCTKNKIVSHLPKMGIKTMPERFEDLDLFREKLLRIKKARMIVFETELNPTLEIPPTDKIAAMVDEVNAKRLEKGWQPVILIVDNTFPTFANMNVFGLGVHCAIESMTKFICGTGENMGGFVAVDMGHDFRLRDEDYGKLYQFLAMMQKDDGLSLAPFPAWDISRTLPSMEMRRHWVQMHAQEVAEFLKDHPKIAKVNYPGMTGDPVQDVRARRLMKDEKGRFSPGYMIYFELKGSRAKAKAMGSKLLTWLANNKSIKVKVSFGQQDTNIEQPSCMTHSSYTREELDLAGISEGGIRLAVGWDTAPYIKDSLEEGLRRI
jgi:methionine-gamma-lyase